MGNLSALLGDTIERPRAPSSLRYSPVGDAVDFCAGIHLEQVQGEPGAKAQCASPSVVGYLELGGDGVRGEAGDEALAEAGEEPPMHIESPYEPEPVSSEGEAAPAPTGQGEPLCAHAPVDPPGDDRLAAERGDLHDIIEADLTPDREGPRDGAGLTWLPSYRPRDDRDAARVPLTQRDARGRNVSTQ